MLFQRVWCVRIVRRWSLRFRFNWSSSVTGHNNNTSFGRIEQKHGRPPRIGQPQPRAIITNHKVASSSLHHYFHISYASAAALGEWTRARAPATSPLQTTPYITFIHSHIHCIERIWIKFCFEEENNPDKKSEEKTKSTILNEKKKERIDDFVSMRSAIESLPVVTYCRCQSPGAEVILEWLDPLKRQISESRVNSLRSILEAIECIVLNIDNHCETRSIVKRYCFRLANWQKGNYFVLFVVSFILLLQRQAAQQHNRLVIRLFAR